MRLRAATPRPRLPSSAPLCFQCGVGHLARVLNSLLVEHIRGLLPALRCRIEEAVGARRRELAMYGEAPPGSSSAARGGLLLTVLDSYSSRFRCASPAGCLARMLCVQFSLPYVGGHAVCAMCVGRVAETCGRGAVQAGVSTGRAGL
jgi:hypothetical protein